MANFSISPYKAEWQELFQSFRQRLLPLFAENLTALYHIGSTSVEGLAAKPIVDILVSVHSLETLGKARHSFEKAGFQWRGENGIAGRRFLIFSDPATGTRLCHVHVFEAFHQELEKHLAFRDFLRANPAKREEYQELKQSLALNFPAGGEHYQNGKAEFIQSTTAVALQVPERFRLPSQVYVWIVNRAENEPKYLLLKRVASIGGFWQAVTGAPFAIETLEQAAVRELFEETHIVPKAPVLAMNHSYTFPCEGPWKKAYRPEVQKIAEYVYVAEVEDLVIPKLSAEHTEFRWCTVKEAQELLKWPSNRTSLKLLHRSLS